MKSVGDNKALEMDPDNEKKAKTVAEYIYTIRCKAAHYRFKHSDISNKEMLIESMEHLLALIKTIFEKMNTYIIEINESENLWTKLKFS